MREGWNGYNVLHDIASRVGALDIGFLPSARASAPDAPAPKVVYLLNSDDFSDADVPADAFVIYQARGRCPLLWACVGGDALRGKRCSSSKASARCTFGAVGVHCQAAALLWPSFVTCAALELAGTVAPDKGQGQHKCAVRRGTTATAARRARMWCCRVPPTPRRMARSSTLRGARSARGCAAPPSRARLTAASMLALVHCARLAAAARS